MRVGCHQDPLLRATGTRAARRAGTGVGCATPALGCGVLAGAVMLFGVGCADAASALPGRPRVLMNAVSAANVRKLAFTRTSFVTGYLVVRFF